MPNFPVVSSRSLVQPWFYVPNSAHRTSGKTASTIDAPSSSTSVKYVASWSIKYELVLFFFLNDIPIESILQMKPISPLDRQHSVRKALGNGLRENVWREFDQRFGVKCVEFYAASEGNCTMMNLNSKIGSCGFVPLFNRFISVLPTRLIRIDDQMQVVRNKAGFCVEAKPGEKGLLVGIIGTAKTDIKTAYNGYANNSHASKKKVIENVFKKGQSAFDTGQLAFSLFTYHFQVISCLF